MDYLTIGLIAITSLISIKGFSDTAFFEKYKFNIGAIRFQKEWIRVISNGFLHVDYLHLFFNMFSLSMFSGFIINFNFDNIVSDFSGSAVFLFIYFAALIGASLLTLYFHKNQSYYSAVGASGAVSGVIFAAIVIDPSIRVGLMLIPYQIPGWIFAILYLGYSLYGMKTNLGNIGHTAHIGGALIGMIIPLLLDPSIFQKDPLHISLMFVPLIILGILAIKQNK